MRLWSQDPGPRVEGQLVVVQRLCKVLRDEAVQEAHATLSELRNCVQERPDISGLDFSKIAMHEHASLKIVPDSIPTLHYHDGSHKYATHVVAGLSKMSSQHDSVHIVSWLLQHLQQISRMTSRDDCSLFSH